MVRFVYLRNEEAQSRDGEFSDPSKVLVESDAVALQNLLEDFKAFAKAIGYSESLVDRIELTEPEEQSEVPGYGDGY